MRKLLCLLIGFLLVCFAVSEVTTTNIDFAGTYQGDVSNLLTRVQKNVDVKYNYVTSSTNIYTQFPDMIIEFDLEFAQYVDVGYHISTITNNGDAHMITRMNIDGQENHNFRVITAGSWYHTNSIFRSLWMTAGHHRIYVQYRTNYGRSMEPIEQCDYCAAIFNVRYFKK